MIEVRDGTVDIQYHAKLITLDREPLATYPEAGFFPQPGSISRWWRASSKVGYQILVAADQTYSLLEGLPLSQFRGALSSSADPITPLLGFLRTNEKAMMQLPCALFSVLGERGHHLPKREHTLAYARFSR